MKAERFIFMLKEALKDQHHRRNILSNFQREIWNFNKVGQQSPIFEVFSDLAHDLDYYEPDPQIRQEDPSYYGDERLEKEISEALKKIEALGST